MSELNIKTGIIYKMMSLNTDKCYIGSTTQNLKKRLSSHKKDYKRYCEGKHGYVTSFEICKAGDPFIVEVERVTGNKRSILAREGFHIVNADNSVNKCIVGRTRKESDIAYYEKNIEKKLQYQQQYRETNKEKINASNICPLCNGRYTIASKAKHFKTKKHLNKIN
jgi:hypothetical protein